MLVAILSIYKCPKTTHKKREKKALRKINIAIRRSDDIEYLPQSTDRREIKHPHIEDLTFSAILISRLSRIRNSQAFETHLIVALGEMSGIVVFKMDVSTDALHSLYPYNMLSMICI